MPGYSDMALGIEKLGLQSLAIPDLFLAEKINQPLVQYAADRNGVPTPPNSPPPGIIHPSIAGIVKPTIAQNFKESIFTPVRRGSDPGTFHRAALEAGVSYKSAVQGKVATNGSEGYARSVASSTKGSPPLSQADNSDTTIAGTNGHGSPPRRINPKIVESSLRCSPWK